MQYGNLKGANQAAAGNALLPAVATNEASPLKREIVELADQIDRLEKLTDALFTRTTDVRFDGSVHGDEKSASPPEAALAPAPTGVREQRYRLVKLVGLLMHLHDTLQT